MTVELKALQQQVKKLEKDLTQTGLADPKLKAEWQDARAAERTASAFEAWLAERVTQVAVGWVLSTVFVRFCEDNGLIEYPFIAGPGERTALARDLQQAFYERHPERGDRDWLKASFDALSVSPVAKALFDEHNPMWSILPSPDQAKALLDFWRQTGEDGELRYDLTDPEWDTRFLGDLYQDLSESARKTYALLQTPEFVEEFILNYTLDPAIEEFGLEPEPPYGHAELPHRLRVIDPACGSGHFLLGAFRRLLTAWQTQSPTTDNWVLIANTLSSVHGVDKNPFAATIARFRLMLAAMRAGNVTRLSANVNFPINVAVGDSLLHGKGAPGIQGEFDFDGSEKHVHTYRTEDVDDYIKSVHILEVGTYHVVVANPPYLGSRKMDACLTAFARAQYPMGRQDLYSCFVQRAIELVDPRG
ncbi:MAG TPA: BREX-2 system adenine-specific DNA-methyltransferase PglX, partial [Polyangia bacterium]